MKMLALALAMLSLGLSVYSFCVSWNAYVRSKNAIREFEERK